MKNKNKNKTQKKKRRRHLLIFFLFSFSSSSSSSSKGKMDGVHGIDVVKSENWVRDDPILAVSAKRWKAKIQGMVCPD